MDSGDPTAARQHSEEKAVPAETSNTVDLSSRGLELCGSSSLSKTRKTGGDVELAEDVSQELKAAGAPVVEESGLLLASNSSVQAEGQEMKGKGSKGAKKKVKDSSEVEQKEVELSESDKAWIESLSGPRLDLMVAVKKLAMRRLETAGSNAYAGVLSPRTLRVMEILLEEYIKDQLRKLDKKLQKEAKVTDEGKKHVEVDVVDCGDPADKGEMMKLERDNDEGSSQRSKRKRKRLEEREDELRRTKPRTVVVGL